jgi:hypothetical protein
VVATRSWCRPPSKHKDWSVAFRVFREMRRRQPELPCGLVVRFQGGLNDPLSLGNGLCIELVNLEQLFAIDPQGNSWKQWINPTDSSNLKEFCRKSTSLPRKGWEIKYRK